MIHGGSLTAARRLFPDAPEPIVDLSTGINPEPYPFAPLDPSCFTRLPEPDSLLALQHAAAQAYAAPDPAMIAAAPGTQALINLLPRLWPQTAVAILGPTYGEHEASWRAAGAAVETWPDLSALRSARAAVVVNPNNPDGRRWAPSALLELARALDLLVVDEAFADLEDPALSLVPHLRSDNLVVLRSFGKTYGLPGVRLGFAVACPARAAAIREALGPWPVSGAAIQIGRQALADAQWLAATSSRQVAASTRLDSLLARAGCRVRGGTRLFRLAESAAAPSLFEQLGRAGLYVRAFPDHPTWLRFGVPPSSAWPRLEAALAVERNLNFEPLTPSYAAEDEQDDDDHHDQPEPAAKHAGAVVAGAPAITAAAGEKQHNQEDDEQRHAGTPLCTGHATTSPRI